MNIWNYQKVLFLSFSVLFFSSQTQYANAKDHKKKHKHSNHHKHNTAQSHAEIIADGQVSKEENLNFNLDLEWLNSNHMQMNVSKILPTQFNDNLAWDIDELSQNNDLQEHGYMTIAKSARIFKNKRPDYFTLENIFTNSFLNAAFNGANIHTYDIESKTVRTSKTIKFLFFSLATIKTNVNIESFENLNDFLEDQVPAEKHHFWKRQANAIKYPLKRITTTYSDRSDITPDTYSHGARTVNFYYDLNGHDSIHISYKIVSFNNVPSLAKSATIDQQYSGTWESLKKISLL